MYRVQTATVARCDVTQGMAQVTTDGSDDPRRRDMSLLTRFFKKPVVPANLG